MKRLNIRDQVRVIDTDREGVIFDKTYNGVETRYIVIFRNGDAAEFDIDELELSDEDES